MVENIRILPGIKPRSHGRWRIAGVPQVNKDLKQSIQLNRVDDERILGFYNEFRPLNSSVHPTKSEGIDI